MNAAALYWFLTGKMKLCWLAWKIGSVIVLFAFQKPRGHRERCHRPHCLQISSTRSCFALLVHRIWQRLFIIYCISPNPESPEFFPSAPTVSWIRLPSLNCSCFRAQVNHWSAAFNWCFDWLIRTWIEIGFRTIEYWLICRLAYRSESWFTVRRWCSWDWKGFGDRFWTLTVKLCTCFWGCGFWHWEVWFRFFWTFCSWGPVWGCWRTWPCWVWGCRIKVGPWQVEST